MVREKGSTVVVGRILCTPLEGVINEREVHMSKRFKKLAHSLYECKYRVVCCPKCRYRILEDEVASYGEQEIYRLSSQRDGVEVIETRKVVRLSSPVVAPSRCNNSSHHLWWW